MRFLRFALLVLALAAGHGGLTAQTIEQLTGILVVDRERLFSGSIYGRRILADIERATAVLVEENRAIETALIAEERDLTDRRPGLSPAAFRELADAFDDKVQGIRAEQDAKSEAIGDSLDAARIEYFQSIIPILAEIMKETRAAAILEKRTVLLSVSLIDVTDLAISRIDAQFGDGTAGARDGASAPAGSE